LFPNVIECLRGQRRIEEARARRRKGKVGPQELLGDFREELVNKRGYMLTVAGAAALTFLSGSHQCDAQDWKIVVDKNDIPSQHL
jgi:hypothetical protein